MIRAILICTVVSTSKLYWAPGKVAGGYISYPEKKQNLLKSKSCNAGSYICLLFLDLPYNSINSGLKQNTNCSV